MKCTYQSKSCHSGSRSVSMMVIGAEEVGRLRSVDRAEDV